MSCQLGKSRQLSFFDSSRESTAPLEILHYDVWSISTPSLSGCRYYVIFIDDFTRFCWMFPISNKSDVYSTFVEFKLLVEKQFHSTIDNFKAIMVVNIILLSLNSFLMTMVFFIDCHVLIHLNKMVSLRGNIVILWIWGLLFLLNPVYLRNFGLMLS